MRGGAVMIDLNFQILQTLSSSITPATSQQRASRNRKQVRQRRFAPGAACR
jgi:hypothetical protein